MSRILLISVRLHDGRYHGIGDGPPSPSRLFQALVAGAGIGGPLHSQVLKALEWLENRDPPVIASPPMTDGQTVKNFVPNNDFDAVGGEARRVGGIRTSKIIRPRVLNAEVPFLYAWGIDDENEHQAQTICALADRLYQLGRGIDLAWAWGEVLDAKKAEEKLSSHPGIVYYPSIGSGGRILACPRSGSLKSLKDRYDANCRKFKPEGKGQTAKQLFSQQPKPRFAQIAYDSPPTQSVYELRLAKSEGSFTVWPLARASHLVAQLRDGAVERLRQGLPQQGSDIERVLVGRKANGADSGPSSQRVKILPLPSVGYHHADRGIRRVLVEVPSGCSLRPDDVNWAFSGLQISDQETGELILTPSADHSMLAHFVGTASVGSRVWRTVTPAALAESAKRRRIDPERVSVEAKNGSERAAEQVRAAEAVIQALRLAEIRARAETIRVQREPFEANGERVEAFAPGTRFEKERLWHVEITFGESITGPLVIGDGRFLGLGVMAPAKNG